MSTGWQTIPGSRIQSEGKTEMGNLTTQEFIRKYTGNRVYIPGMSTAECVALFWAFNREVNEGEAYSAPGAANLYTTTDGDPYIWDTYDRIPSWGLAHSGDWAIWSGVDGPYTNGGNGHVAMAIVNNGDGTGWFFTQNPNAPAIMLLRTEGIIGLLRPRGIEFGTYPPANTRTVDAADGVNVRTGPRTTAPLAYGVAVGQSLAVVGYVAGQDVSGRGDNAWYRLADGNYVWANGAGDDLSGLPFLGAA